jgi:hypothetical protein
MKISIIFIIVFAFSSCTQHPQYNTKPTDSGKSNSTDSKWSSSDIEGIAIKILGSIAPLIVAIYQIKQSSVKKNRLQKDIEILEKLEKDSESYISVKASVEKSIRELYSVSRDQKIQSPGDFIFGVVLIVVPGIWSIYIIANCTISPWWHLLTVSVAFVGLGGILNGIKKKVDDKTQSG